MVNKSTLNELKIAQQELITHHKDFEKCAEELQTATDNLEIGEIEKKRRVKEVDIVLEDMMFTISHKIRKSVANILGISKLLCDDINLGDKELREMLTIIIQSAESLNISTEELSKFIRLNKNHIDNA